MVLGFGGQNPDCLHGGVGKAQEEKLLDINQKTATYLGAGWTSLPPAKEDRITVRHHLMLTTGLDDGVPDRDNTSPASLIYKADVGTSWARPTITIPTCC